ncbi:MULTISPECIES: hypothetical protein [Pseudomonadaceae]|uniref:hypothetical protein n=1 Tax=Pseudomonadaceae TaxID=135621 RepID=UPI0011CED9A4|nr:MULTISPECIES: hypothetical protein [Pseudomonadaceae]
MKIVERRIPQDLRHHLTQDLPKSRNRVIPAFDAMCTEFLEDLEGPETYQDYLDKQLKLISEGKFNPAQISSSESEIHKKPSDGLKSLTHHLTLALTYRILAEDLEDEGLVFEMEQAISSALLHLGACIPSLFMALGKSIDISEKNTAVAKKRHQKSKRSIENFTKLIRALAPENGWKSRKHIVQKCSPQVIDFEKKIELNLSGDIDARLMRWMRDEEAPAQAVNDTLEKSQKNR